MKGNQSTTYRYTIKYPFGTGYIRPSGIIHSLPSNNKAQFARRGGFMEFIERRAEELDGSRAKICDKNIRLMFGTEKIYLFLRMYSLLVSILSEVRDSLPLYKAKGCDEATKIQMTMSGILPDTKMKDNSSSRSWKRRFNWSEYEGYNGVVTALQDCLSGRMDLKTFESICRSITEDKVFKLASLPRLIEKCSDILMKVAKEDLCLSLFDLSQLTPLVRMM